MDFEEAIEPVSLAGEQRLQLQLLRPFGQLRQRGLGVGQDRLITLGLGQFDQLGIVAQARFEGFVVADLALQLGALAHHPLRLGRIAPQLRRFGERVQLRQADLRGIEVKATSSAARATA
jgi:hypothetical protein